MAYRLIAPNAATAARAVGCAVLWAVVAALAAPSVQAGAGAEPRTVELVMVQQPGCTWCARWNDDIAPIWPRTAAGAFAPLRRAQLREMPGDLALDRRVSFTPTFLLIDADGQELGRLEGYPGEDFFWPLIERLLVDAAGFVPAEGDNH